ncbi:ABC transporter substrate-binding protein [[Mycobacterium] vasticus]|uniref:ABC transporter substrate-binding protein n=1 Tax=[Mycobacterium] vasticus TaxID=2875777 RepID=A0ABU5Z2V1_9MYCO|nr:ABC transporter substrate-binding protein [Mycolicibacter sp. MYC017]MEB3070273.1 ABC transporter substrate-binding protein [Mycolicibacter sp. MYC017]
MSVAETAHQPKWVTNTRHGEIHPLRVGLVQDWALGLQPTQDYYDAVRLGLDEAVEDGLLERPVELEIKEAWGLPNGTAHDVHQAWRELVDSGVLAVIGPSMSEDSVSLRDTIETLKVPTLTLSATFGFGGEYCFQTPNGTFADETQVGVDYLRHIGVSSMGLVYDMNFIGEEYGRSALHAARRRKLTVSSSQMVPSFATHDMLVDSLGKIRHSGAEALMYVGVGALHLQLASALAELDWNPPKVTGTSFIGSIEGFERKQDFEGWVGVEQFDERNPVFVKLMDSFERRFGRRPAHGYTAVGYDQGRLLAEGLANAKPTSPSGVKAGLEMVRMLPAAAGAPGTVMSLAPYDHRAYKGDYFVLRTIKNGENVLVGSATDFLPRE